MNEFGVKLNGNCYKRRKTVGNHGTISLFYMYTQEKKKNVIDDKNVEVLHSIKTSTNSNMTFLKQEPVAPSLGSSVSKLKTK